MIVRKITAALLLSVSLFAVHSANAQAAAPATGESAATTVPAAPAASATDAPVTSPTLDSSLPDEPATILGAAGARPTGRIGYIDIDRVTRSVRDGGGAMDDLSDKTRRMQKDFDDKAQKAAGLQRELEKNRGVEAPAESEKKRREIRRLRDEMATLETNYKRDVSRVREVVIAPLVKKIGYAIQDEAKAQSLDMVLRGEAVFYAIPAVDITDSVIARLQKSGVAGAGATSTTGSTEAVESRPRTEAPPEAAAPAESTSAGDPAAKPTPVTVSIPSPRRSQGGSDSGAATPRTRSSERATPTPGAAARRARPVDRQQEP